MRITYTPEAIEDLMRLREFIENKNPQAAHRIALFLRKAISQLKTFPYLGAEVLLAPNPKAVRDLVVGNYIVRYLIRNSEIFILRSWHQKEDRYNIKI